MSLFKLDSKIYGAWLVEKAANAAVNCHCSMIADDIDIEPADAYVNWNSSGRPLKKKIASQLKKSVQE
ncbi:MAG: hypothetical protein ONB27_12700 [candidate division KSB1 bacterium]|nr:hypothetical protein [candidate division KSB1 bacterium]